MLKGNFPRHIEEIAHVNQTMAKAQRMSAVRIPPAYHTSPVVWPPRKPVCEYLVKEVPIERVKRTLEKTVFETLPSSINLRARVRSLSDLV